MQQDLIFTIVDNHLTASNDASGSIYPKPDKITYSSIFECEQCEHLDEGILSLAKADKECISNFGNPKQSCSQIFKGRRVYYTKPFALWLKLNRDRLINNKSSNRLEDEKESLTKLRGQLIKVDIQNRLKDGLIKDIELEDHKSVWIKRQDAMDTIAAIIKLTQTKMNAVFINSIPQRLAGCDINKCTEIIKDGLNEVYDTLNKINDI